MQVTVLNRTPLSVPDGPANWVKGGVPLTGTAVTVPTPVDFVKLKKLKLFWKIKSKL